MKRSLLLLLVPCTAWSSGPPVALHAPRVLLESPSEAVAGEPFVVSILAQERWGREGPRLPHAGVDREVLLLLSSTDPDARMPAQVRISGEQGGRITFRAVLFTEGLQRIRAEGFGDLPGETAPIRVLTEPPAERVFWGDLHAHLHTAGAGHAGEIDPREYATALVEALTHARDVSRLDFCAVTPHIQTAGGLRKVWPALLRTVESANAPGSFVALPGFEWQGPTGDHCVLLPRSVPFEAPADFSALAESVTGWGGVLTAHAVFLPSLFDPGDPFPDAVEVTRDSKSTHELGLAALRSGGVPAFLGCSDTHGGAIGSTSLTGLRAPALTGEAILRAVRERRTWATNGERIVVDIGVEVREGVPLVRVRGTGTGPIDRIEIYRGAEAVAEARGFGASEEFDFSWEDADSVASDRARPLTYHAKVVQATANRYDPALPDVAITSPVLVIPASPPAPSTAPAAPEPESPPSPVFRGTGEALASLPLPLDPRALAALSPVGDAERRLAQEFAERWGYTTAPFLGETEPALRVRVVAEGAPGGRVVSSQGEAPLVSGDRGWAATLDRARLPQPGETAVLAFDRPAQVSAVFLEDLRGTGALVPRGKVTDLALQRSGAVAQAIVTGAVDTVDVRLDAVAPDGTRRPLWSGRTGPGPQVLALDAAALGPEDALSVRFGFAGWRRTGGAILSGHEAARADGFGALADGRAVVALAEELIAVDPVTGAVERRAYPEGRTHESGRAFCAVPLADGRTLVRGAEGPDGGWVAALDPATGAWSSVEPGPETGTAAPHPHGGYAWLTGMTLHRRSADGARDDPLTLEAGGRLLGFDPAGRPAVAAGDRAARLARGSGRVVERIALPVLALQADGSLLALEGLDARHAEVAREVRLVRVLADGSRTGPHPIAVKPSPVLSPPVRAALAPDGALLLLCGTTWWRREPGHDWWGAAVERWEEVWAGELRAE